MNDHDDFAFGLMFSGFFAAVATTEFPAERHGKCFKELH